MSKAMPKKEVIAKVRLEIEAGKANPGPPIAPALGPHGVNMMEFCKQFNAESQSKMGYVLPVTIYVFKDRSFHAIIKEPTMSNLIKKTLGLKKGSTSPGKETAAHLTLDQMREIAKTKQPDLSASDETTALKTVAGTAKSMGITCDEIAQGGEA